MYQLELLGPDGATARYPLSVRPFYVGRGAVNDLILLDDAASTQHFRVWSEADGPRIEDLGSRNGTWVNGERLAGALRLKSGDDVRVGAGVHLRIREVGTVEGAVPQIEDVDLGLRYRFGSDRFTIADSPAADIVLPGAGPGATLLVERDGEIWLGMGDELVEIAVDQPFVVAGRRFCLRHAREDAGVTRDLLMPHELTPTRYPYEVDVRLQGATGPEATFRNARTGVTHTILAGNPALLVYILARKQAADASLASQADRGWVADDDIAVGIWGRAEATRQAGNLNVLVWRVRKELQGAGFDAWCLEKRRKHMRLRVDLVRVA